MDVFRVCCFTSIFLLEYTIQASTGEFTPPRIFPGETERIIGPYDNFTLRCEGKEPVTWKPPNNSLYGDVEPKFSTISISSSSTPDSEYIYGSILNIQNASYLDTGFYYCLGDTTDLEDLSRVSNIYIYVDDPEHLSVLPEFPDAFVVPQFSEVILPCRPTSPNVEVRLIQQKAQKEVLLNTPDQEGQIVEFDRRKGFIVNEVNNLGQIFYECRFSRDNNEYTSVIVLVIQSLTDSIAKPLLEEISGGHTVIGEKLLLRCTIRFEMPTLFHMDWIVPDQNGITNGRIFVSESITGSQDTYYQELTINETNIEDQGEYVCIVKDSRNKSNHTKFIRIYDKDEHFIHLTEENELYDISVQAGEPNITWKINVKAHPLPKLAWYNHKGEEILTGWSNNNKPLKYNIVTQGSTETTLVINDITIQDRGVYELKAINDFEEKILKLNLNVTALTDSIAKPLLEEISGGHTVIGETLLLRCTIRLEMPTPFHVDWIVPDQNGITNGRIFVSESITVSEDTYYQEQLTINETNIEDQGEYVCIVKDSRNKSNHTKFIRIYDKDEHFIHLTEENELYDISVQTGEPNITWKINVKAHPLPKLAWYNHKGEEILTGWSNNNNPLKYNIVTHGSTETTLVINDITIQDRGVYELKAINDFDEKILKLTLNVTGKVLL